MHTNPHRNSAALSSYDALLIGGHQFGSLVKFGTSILRPLLGLWLLRALQISIFHANNWVLFCVAYAGYDWEGRDRVIPLSFTSLCGAILLLDLSLSAWF